MNRVKVGFFSLSHASPSGDDRTYLEWHQLDHMPEQYQLPGMVLGQRWAATPACRAARIGGTGGWADVDHVVCYLMGDPVDQTIDDFFTLGRHLAELGRFAGALPAQYVGALRLLETHAAPRVLVSAEVVPFRPNRGVYLIVEELLEGTEPEVRDAYLQRQSVEILPGLVSVPGVAGAWAFATTPAIRRPPFTDGAFRMTLCYLDDEPAAVGERLGAHIKRAWKDAPARIVLGAPYESMMSWEWNRFGPS
jgi:hypothetical protein